MATYGSSLYGMSKYGTEVEPNFDVSPFLASPVGYTSILLDWAAPKGSWAALRLLRNRYGWAVNENDGEVLLEDDRVATSFVDMGVVGGRWHYYTIFVLADGAWSRAGTTSLLMPKNLGHTELLYSLVPEHYKVNVLPGNAVTDDSNTINEFVKPFLSIFGFGFDMLKSYYDANSYTNDAMRTRYGNIESMAEQFGIHYEANTPAYLFRQRVRDAATLGREKGTLEQIRSLIAQTTGYDTELRLSDNLMLSDDQADFDHPSYPEWDPGVNYAKGERVKYSSYLYEANTNGAYGESQKPTGTATTNSYWKVISLGNDTTLVNANGDVAGWEEVSFTTGVTPGTDGVLVGVGAQNPTAPNDQAGNALIVRNTNSGNTTATLGVRSVARLKGQSSMDPQQPVLWGIPVPCAYEKWSISTEYHPGDLVVFHGRTYKAIKPSVGITPPDTASSNAQWQALAYDERVQLCLSGYVQAYADQRVAVYPFVEFYDDHGALICALYSDSTPSYTVMDTFTQGWSDWGTRSTDVGGAQWTQALGQWKCGGYSGGVAYPGNTSASMVTIPGHSDGTVSATFVTAPSGSLNQGIVFRAQNSANYWRATRTGLHRIEGSAWKATYAYSTAFADGDRITVEFSGAIINVKRNGTQVLTISNTTFQTATVVGMVVA